MLQVAPSGLQRAHHLVGQANILDASHPHLAQLAHPPCAWSFPAEQKDPAPPGSIGGDGEIQPSAIAMTAWLFNVATDRAESLLTNRAMTYHQTGPNNGPNKQAGLQRTAMAYYGLCSSISLWKIKVFRMIRDEWRRQYSGAPSAII